MFETHEPVVGTWYVNQTGKLFKVKLLVFNEQDLGTVFVQYLDGSTKKMTQGDWACLKLNKRLHDASLQLQLH